MGIYLSDEHVADAVTDVSELDVNNALQLARCYTSVRAEVFILNHNLMSKKES